MTIEFALRRRARNARILAGVWLGLALLVSVTVYFSLPSIAAKTLAAVSTGQPPSGSEPRLIGLSILALGVSIVIFAVYSLARGAIIETELSLRFNGFADALCVAGKEVANLEKAVALFVPKSRFLEIPELLASKEFEKVADFVKALK